MRETKTGRRGFLATAGALACTAALPRGSAAADRASNLGGFQLGVQSYTYRKFTLDRTVKAIGDLGLSFVEFYRGHVPTNSTPEQIGAVRKLCADHGITPIAFGVERFTKDHAQNQRLFEFARALGVRSLSADPDPDSFESLDTLVDEHQIRIAIHPHGPQGKQLHRWYSAEVILEAVKDHHPLIGTCLDTGHLIRSAQPPFGKMLDPAQQIRVMGARNFGIHLKDHDNERRTDVVFGKGVLDVAAVLRALHAVRFDGSISIEYEAHPDEPSADMRACVQVVQEAVRGLGSKD